MSASQRVPGHTLLFEGAPHVVTEDCPYQTPTEPAAATEETR